MATVTSPPERGVVVQHVSWETYERLLADLADQSSPRLTFDRGTLEIMSPTPEHEELNRTIALLVEVVAEELGVDIRSLGSATFRREDLARGFEPDSCFYMQSIKLVKGKRELDLRSVPPPDLVIEIDITSSSLDKLPIYAQVGVPEVWRYDGATLRILALSDQAYREVARSMAFAVLSTQAISDFVEASRSSTRVEWLRSLRAWIRQNRC